MLINTEDQLKQARAIIAIVIDDSSFCSKFSTNLYIQTILVFGVPNERYFSLNNHHIQLLSYCPQIPNQAFSKPNTASDSRRPVNEKFLCLAALGSA
jgi:hypothetical protein